jgi:hypothetical protein
LVGYAGVVRVVRGGRGEAGGDGGRKSGRYVDPSVSEPRTGNAPGSERAHDPGATTHVGSGQSRASCTAPLSRFRFPNVLALVVRATLALTYSRRTLVSAQWLCVSRENNGTACIRWGEWTQAVAPYGHRLYNTWSAIATVVCHAGRMEAKLPSRHSPRSSSSACAAAAGATARRNGSARTGQVLPRSGVLVAEEYSARENWTPCAWCNRLFQSSVTWSLAQNAFG